MDVHKPSTTPSSAQVKLAKPEVVSEAIPLKLTGLTYQPLEPDVPLNVPVILGSWLSTLAASVPIVELSPHDESAQKARLLLPSLNGILQSDPEQAKVIPFSEPSRARILWPTIGSVPFSDS